MAVLEALHENVPMEKRKIYPWWYGGLAGVIASVTLHPVDLTKVRLQTAPLPKPTLVQMVSSIVKADGVPGLYAGLTGTILRQLTYTTARLGIYDVLKDRVIPRSQVNNMLYLLPASVFSGMCGGLAGNFADVVMVRMQNDASLPVDQRRNYKNALDGVWKIYKNEGGIRTLFTGWKPNMVRGVLITASQVVTYDMVKDALVRKAHMDPKAHSTHFLASISAGLVATTVSSPADVIKTRIMSSSGEGQPAFKILRDLVKKEGPGFMFRGWLPAFARLGPNTMLIFLVLEQLRKWEIGMPHSKTA